MSNSLRREMKTSESPKNDIFGRKDSFSRIYEKTTFRSFSLFFLDAEKVPKNKLGKEA